MKAKRLIVAAALAAAGPAGAHDFWANGEPVPAWVKSSCCGPQDVHRLRRRRGACHGGRVSHRWLDDVVPISRALPSPDGSYWAFGDAGLFDARGARRFAWV